MRWPAWLARAAGGDSRSGAPALPWMLLLAALLVAGLAVTLDRSLRTPEAAPEVSPEPAAPAARAGAEPSRSDPLRALQAQLAEEAAARMQLAAELESLRQEIELLQLALEEPPAEEHEEVAGAPASEEAEAGEGFDPELLERAGVDPREVDELRDRFEDWQLDRLYLRDQAIREGWARTPRYRDAVRELEADLYGELGEEGYDLMLYAAGRPNRVVVDRVFSGSAAARAGVEPGDVVLRYGDERIFDVRDLRSISTEGSAGELVDVDLMRGTRRVRVRIPRGPLGAVIRGKRGLAGYGDAG